jgi:HEAT repeat protein
MILKPNGLIVALLRKMISPRYRALLQRAAAVVISIACCGTAAADGLWNLPLDDILAIASGARPSPVYLPEPVYQSNAIHTLGYKPAASPEEETKIAATLGKLLTAEDTSLHTEAAKALGLRGRVEFVPQLFALIETEPYLFSAFFAARQLKRGAGPSEKMLRAGLRSKVDKARERIMAVIGDFKMVTMRKEIEKLLEGDPSESVRHQAGYALRKLGAVESAPVLQRAIETDPRNHGAFYALSALGGDAQIPTLLAALDSGDELTKTRALQTLSEIKVTNSKPLVEAFLRVLQQEPGAPSLSAASGLARFNDQRALPFLRRIAEIQPPDLGKDRICVSAIANAGGPDAVALLNEMLVNRWRNRGHLEEAMEKLGDPSSARLVWAIYKKNPMRTVVSGWCMTIGGYKKAIRVLAACADKELLESIRAHAALTTGYPEKETFDRLVVLIEQRLSAKTTSAQN